MKKLIAGLSLQMAFLPMAFSNPNACDDYLARHYKKDLKLISATYRNKRFESAHYQEVELKIKNTGQSDFPSGANRRLRFRINGRNSSSQVSMPMNSGQIKTVRAVVPRNFLRHCQKVNIQLDFDHSFGQWGCQVWNNDSSSFKIRLAGSRTLCLNRPIIRPRPRPVPRPRPIPRPNP